MVDSLELSPFEFRAAKLPLLISFPHEGAVIPHDVADRMTEDGQSSRDTDWFLKRLYDFDELAKAGTISANYSRYVIDLNRAAEDVSLYPGQNTTGLFPLVTFAELPIYRDGGEPDEAERKRRVEAIWRPYHNCIASELKRMHDAFGIAVLFEAHSIASQVPFLFEGTIPDLNVGTNREKSCDPSLTGAVRRAVASTDYSHVFNERFIGGYITRQYGSPDNGIHAIQLELSQATYLEESSKTWDATKAERIQPVLRAIMKAILSWVETQRPSAA